MSPLAHTPARRTWAEIDLSALRHNLDTIRRCVGAKVGVIAVVKADAYGHGIQAVVPLLAPHVEMLAVANVNEAIATQALAPDRPVLLLSPALPDERPEIVARGFIPLVSSVEEAAAYSALARIAPAPVHLKLDTGMGRAGVWHENALAAWREISALHGVKITGIASHLPVADEDEVFTNVQLAVFHRRVAELRERGFPDVPRHVANSAGAIAFSEQAGDLVRVGLALYGSSPCKFFQPQLRPVLTWKTRVALVRDVPAGSGVSYGRTFITPRPMRLATLAVGYADGYSRHLSNAGTEVLLQGHRCAVVGRVTMDQIVVDVSDLQSIEEGAEVVLLGRQGSEEILAAELAAKAGTIPWDVFTRIGSRVARVAGDV